MLQIKYVLLFTTLFMGLLMLDFNEFGIALVNALAALALTISIHFDESD